MTDRRKDAKDLKLCYNCLSNKHQIKECKSKVSCRECNKRHHTLLHDPDYSAEVNHGSIQSRTYLQVIPITLTKGNISVKANALLDNGSDTTLIKSSLAKRLQLSGKNKKLQISNVLAGKQTFNSEIVDFIISSEVNENEMPIDQAWVVDNLNINVCPYNISEIKEKYKHLKDIPFPKAVNKDVEILIGADAPEVLLHLEYVKGSSLKDPMAVKTLFGWTLFGGGNTRIPKEVNFLSKLDLKVERFWEQDSYGTMPRLAESLLTKDGKRALVMLKERTKLVDGRFEIGMLWKDEDVKLKNNRALAETRLASTEKRLNKFPEIKSIYCDKIEEYVQMKHVRKLTPEEASITSNKTNYIPHHFVLEPNKPGKIRIVWDASSKFQGSSLNDSLLKGPDFLNNLVTVLSRFRRGKIAVVSDVEKMYHQVLVPREDQDAMRFLWREDSSQEISEYKTLVHPFGKKDSPCCANWALKGCVTKMDNVEEAASLQKLNERDKSEVVEAVTEDFYMDDYLGSFDKTKDAQRTCSNMSEVLKDRRFHLTKWLSNDKEFLETIDKKNLSTKIVCHNFTRLPEERTLGIWWNPTTDNFFFNIKVRNYKKTKRGLLSFLSSIFDPLGFLTPFLTTPKLILQTLWKEKIGWDEEIPQQLITLLKAWEEMLPNLADIKIPRWYQFPKSIDREIELHVFSDASFQAYGAAAYFRTSRDGVVNCSFIIGKSRLAPIKRSTAPRLELQAAVVASRIKDCIVREMVLHTDKIFMWTDSQVTLCYIRNEQKRFSNYVMNRTYEIRERTEVKDWNYVPGELNVADVCTRTVNESQVGEK